jgi:predicted amidohydrolase
MEAPTVRVAAVLRAPVNFGRDASCEEACASIADAGAIGAQLVTFSETWLPGYPWFVLFHEGATLEAASVAYLRAAVEIPSATTDALCSAARRAGVDVAIGIAELDAATRGTVYCTLLFISHTGEILGRHRKLKPTFRERTVWGEGDGSTLVCHQRPYARLSGLNCWEHAMMLPGYALAIQGTEIHVATWPLGLLALDNPLPRAFARQAGCYVISIGGRYERTRCATGASTYSYDFGGGAEIISPPGTPAYHATDSDLLVADLDLDLVAKAKVDADIGGHYSRPDVFDFRVLPPARSQPQTVPYGDAAQVPLAEAAQPQPMAASGTDG